MTLGQRPSIWKPKQLRGLMGWSRWRRSTFFVNSRALRLPEIRYEPRQSGFLSYASQDAGAAHKICDALRAAGVEVWLDQSGGLVGGDAWDQKIRQQIKECALFVPIISASTQARREGYFRREWKQAAARTHDMADGTPFLLPIVIDATRDSDLPLPKRAHRGITAGSTGWACAPSTCARSNGSGRCGCRRCSHRWPRPCSTCWCS